MQFTIVYTNGHSEQFTVTSNVNVRTYAEIMAMRLGTTVKLIIGSR